MIRLSVRRVSLVFGLWMALAHGQEPRPANAAAVAEVTAGWRGEALASWWGFDPADATESLQAAIDSGVPKLTVDQVGAPWIVRPIKLASNQEIVFAEGVEVRAKEGEFKGTNDSLFSAANRENIVLRGYGATLRMRRADYDNPELYKKAEWRHCLSIRSCTNVQILGLTMAESGGDGIYLGTATRGVTNKDILIRDVVCDRNYRQGISVITAENLLIENTIMRGTGGTAPQAGIDFEPNHPGERLVNVVMRDCLSEDNNGCGYVLYLRPMKATSEPISVRFENCRAANNRGAAFALTTGDSPELAVDGTVEVVGGTFASPKPAVLNVSKPANRSQLTLTDCTLVAGEAPPIAFASGQHSDQAMGGVTFANCTVIDPVARTPMVYIDRGGGVPLAGIGGTLVLERDGGRVPVELTTERLAEWLPVTAMRAIPRVSLAGKSFRPLGEPTPAQCAFAHAWIRRTGAYLLHAQAGDEVSLGLRHAQVGRYQGNPAPVVVTGPDGAAVQQADIPFQGEGTIAFRAPASGVYRVAVDARQNRMALVSSTHPACLAGEGGPVRLIHSAGNYYFHVPAGTREFAVRVAGEGMGEAVRAELLDPAGEVVQEADDVVQTHQFEILRETPPAVGETWCLRLSRPSTIAWEDHAVDLRGIPPLLAPSPEALLVPAE